jgi:hypothetical protein
MVLPRGLLRRLRRLDAKEANYWEDELYSDEAITNLEYRRELLKAYARRKPAGCLDYRPDLAKVDRE